MDMETPTNWEHLPAKNLHNIFENFDFPDVMNCFLICKNWYHEANFYFKDKLWFSTNNVETIKDVEKSKRSFQCLRVFHDEVKEECLDILKASDILEALISRKLKPTDPISEAFIEFGNYPALSKIIKLLGKQLKILTLRSDTYATRPGQCARKSFRYSAGLPRSYANLDYGCLSSVEKLSIERFENTFLNISRHFGNLRSLTLSSDKMNIERVSEDLLREFIDLNPLLTTLNLKEAPFFVDDKDEFNVQVLLHFENSKHLEELYLNKITSVEDLDCLSMHFQNLKVIQSEQIADTIFHPVNVDRMFKLGIDVNHCSIKYTSDLSPSLYKESWFNSRNERITRLNMFEVSIEEDVLIVLTKCFPNMKSFICINLESPSLLLFSEMSKNWLKLEYLYIGIHGTFEKSSVDEICDFQNLKKLNFDMTYGPLIMNQFFTYFVAENLKAVSFDFYYTCGILDNHNFTSFSQNCPNVRCLKFDGPPHEKQLMESILSNFPNLHTLNILCRFDCLDEGVTAEMALEGVLQDILSFRKTKLEVKITTSRYLGSFDKFCNENEAMTEFKKGQLKQIRVQGKIITFKTHYDDYE